MVVVVPAPQKRRKRIVKGERRGNAACFKSLNIRDGFSFLFHKKFRKGCTHFATWVINLILLAGIQFSDDNTILEIKIFRPVMKTYLLA